MKTRSIVAALAFISLVGSLTACSSLLPTAHSGTSGGAYGGTSSSQPANAPAAEAKQARSYSATDLPGILTATQTALGVTGTVLDNDQFQAAADKLGGGGGIGSLLSQSGLTVSPEECGNLISSALSISPSTDGLIGSVLSYDTTTITLASKEGAVLPTDLSAGASDRAAELFDKCGTMQLTMDIPNVGSQSITLDVQKLDVTTNADLAVGIQESLQLPEAAGGTTMAVTMIEAVKGNLFMTATNTGTADATPALTAAVNAVIAAAA